MDAKNAIDALSLIRILQPGMNIRIYADLRAMQMLMSSDVLLNMGHLISPVLVRKYDIDTLE